MADSNDSTRPDSSKMSEFGPKIGLKKPLDFSNLAAPTLKNGQTGPKKRFSVSMVASVADSVADSNGKTLQKLTKVSRKPLRSRNGYQYRKARLVCPEDLDLFGDWYILFYTTDAGASKTLIRKRVLKEEFRAIQDVEQRFRFAQSSIKEINLMLYNDWHTEEKESPILESFDFSRHTLLDAITYVSGIKEQIEGVRPTTIKEYSATKSTLVDFFMNAKISQDLLLRHVNDAFLRKYFDYLKQVRKSTNKTYNARRLILHSVMNTLIKRDPKLFGGANPIARVKFLKVESNGHAAYSDEQMKQIRDAITKGNETHLLFFIRFMYYTLARPKELRLLKISDIDLQNKRILFRAEISKSVIQQHVGINSNLMSLIVESGIMQYPPSYYIFSNPRGGDRSKHNPGSTPVATSYFYKRIKPYITALGFNRENQNYTLYSFKHTGAIALYKATKDIKLIQAQCRHQSIEVTNIYLRDLGVLTDFDQLNRWNSPI